MNKARVIVISSDIRFKSSLTTALRTDLSLDLISGCYDVSTAPQYIQAHKSNALVLDLEKIILNEAYIKNLMQKYNLTVIAVGKNPAYSMLKAGVNNCISKPANGDNAAIQLCARDIINRIKLFAMRNGSTGFNEMRDTVDSSTKIIAIASSTGGTDALVEVLKGFEPDCPPILIVQHMPSVFTKQFADRLDRLSKIRVKEAVDREYIKKGTAYIAPGDLHMKLIKKASKLAVECFFADKMHGVRPAADILFSSIVPIMGGNVVCAVLTGMGSDGARGLYELHNKGAKVVGQNKETCVVYGMPKAAFDLGAVDYELPLDKITDKIRSLL